MTAVYRLKNNLWAFDLVALGAGTGGEAFQVDPCFKTKCRPTFLPGPLDPPLLIAAECFGTPRRDRRGGSRVLAAG